MKLIKPDVITSELPEACDHKKTPKSKAALYVLTQSNLQDILSGDKSKAQNSAHRHRVCYILCIKNRTKERECVSLFACVCLDRKHRTLLASGEENGENFH